MSIIPGIENLAPERTSTSSGLAGSPKPLPVALLDLAIAARTSSHRPVGQLLAGREVVVAGLGGDREAGRRRQAGDRHLGEARALAAEQVLHPAVALGRAVAPGVDVALGGPVGAIGVGAGLGPSWRAPWMAGGHARAAARGASRGRGRIVRRAPARPGCGRVATRRGASVRRSVASRGWHRVAGYTGPRPAARALDRLRRVARDPVHAQERPRDPFVDERASSSPSAEAYNATLIRRVDQHDAGLRSGSSSTGRPTPFESGQYMTIGVFVDGKIAAAAVLGRVAAVGRGDSGLRDVRPARAGEPVHAAAVAAAGRATGCG